MIDCGEGSYLRWHNAKYKWENLKYIIITHLHPDHIGGLISLLFYRKIYGIKQTLTLIGPNSLKKYILEYFIIAFHQELKPPVNLIQILMFFE